MLISPQRATRGKMVRMEGRLGPVETTTNERSQSRSLDRGPASQQAQYSQRDERGFGIKGTGARRHRSVGSRPWHNARARNMTELSSRPRFCLYISMHQVAYSSENISSLSSFLRQLRQPRGTCCPSTTERVSFGLCILAISVRTCSTSAWSLFNQLAAASIAS
jgi:hypothetical protein